MKSPFTIKRELMRYLENILEKLIDFTNIQDSVLNVNNSFR